MSEERATRKVMISPELMEAWATRDADGNRLEWNWRQPDADGWWEPVVTTDYADNLVTAERTRLRAAFEVLTFDGLDEWTSWEDEIRPAVLALLDPKP